jgi:ABC-type Fe2+-enterobactin transport system substrate-binding protein
MRLAGGLSVFATLAQARAKSRQYPFLGVYIAVIDIPDAASASWERTLPRSRGHHTVRGDPAELLKLVTAVVPIQGSR